MAGMKEGDEKNGSKSNPLPNAQYAIVPDGEILEGWTKENKEELDDLVRHQLHSRRAKFKRSMKGFKQYVRRRKFTIKAISIFADKFLQLLDCSLQFMPP